jgi:hypothetical protein
MHRKHTKQAKRRSAAAKLKLRVRVHARPTMGRGLDLGDVRLQLLLGAWAVAR